MKVIECNKFSMYNKTLSIYNNNIQEIVVNLKDSCLEKVLYYRDEGNMNIVLSIYAQENEEKYVIRFKKISSDSTERNSNDHKHELMSFIAFEELLQKYFDHFTVVPKIVFVDVDINALNEFLMRDRPAVRKKKIIGSNYGLLYRDVAFLPKKIYIEKPLNGEFKDSQTICIEIKVKQGYMMDDDDSSTIGYDMKKCRYCYLQYLKLKTSKISSISQYCPIDLFSGNADRMSRAIKGLFENPQNNLKMFQDGKMVYNEYSPDKSSLKRIMKSLFPDEKSADRQELLIINLIRKVLLKDFTCCDMCVDVCSTYKLDDDVHLRYCHPEKYPQLSKNCILYSILKAQHLVKDNFSTMEYLETNINYNDDYDQIIQDYRMGSTALDCSVMVTFRRIQNENFDIESDNVFDKSNYIKLIGPTGHSHHFITNVTVVDLDEKKDSFAHFRKYKKQYQESKIAYLEYVNSMQHVA